MHQLRLFFNFSHSMQTRQIDSRLEFVIFFPFAAQGKHLETLLEDFPPGAVQHEREICVFLGGLPAKLMMMNINIVRRTVRFWYCLLRAATHKRNKKAKPTNADL